MNVFSPPSPTETAAPYDILRDGLIWGRWTSGDRLMPQHLKVELSCTGAALREALLRLVGEGFVEAEKHQGFRVASHSQASFNQHAHLRLLLESEGALMSLERGDFEWEMQLNAALHSLDYIEAEMEKGDDIRPFLRRWSQQDWEFHRALISACGSAALLGTHKLVYDIYRMSSVTRITDFGFARSNRDQHRAIYEAAIARDKATCASAIHEHLATHAVNLEARMTTGPDRKAKI